MMYFFLIWCLFYCLVKRVGLEQLGRCDTSQVHTSHWRFVKLLHSSFDTTTASAISVFRVQRVRNPHARTFVGMLFWASSLKILYLQPRPSSRSAAARICPPSPPRFHSSLASSLWPTQTPAWIAEYGSLPADTSERTPGTRPTSTASCVGP